MIVVKIHEEADKYSENLTWTLSPSEHGFRREGIASKLIPQPQLLNKEHKDI